MKLLRLLQIEDNESDADLIRRTLERAGYEVRAQRVETEQEFRAALANATWDLVIADFALPNFSAPAALALLRATGVDMPFIVVSAQIGEETAVEMMHQGAHDYLMKDRLARLIPAVARELAEAEGRRERRRSEAQLRASEERYRLLFKHANDAIFLSFFEPGAPPGKFIDVNDVACQRLGYTRDELLGLSSIDIDATDSEQLQNRIYPHFATKRPHVFESVHCTKSGELLPVEVSVQLITFRDRTAALAIARDISERKRAEQEREKLLKELDELLTRQQQVMTQMPIGCISTDLEYRVTFWNRAAEKLFGFSQQEIVGSFPWPVFLRPDQDHERSNVLRARLMAETAPAQHTLENRTKDGRTLLCSWHTAPIVDSSGNITGHLALVEDITERKRLEEQLRQAQKMEAVGQLAGGVAHDFNNILAAVLMQLGLLQNNPALPKATRESIRELEQGTLRATQLTRQLLLFSRQEVAQMKTLQLKDVILDLLKMLRRLLGENITIEFVPPAQSVWVTADPGMLEQVLMNLCINARDAMPRGGRITIAVEQLEITPERAQANPQARPGDFVCLTVADTGCGMDEQTLRRIFEPFFTTKEPGKGTGLGLATVYGIAKQHDGWIEVESAVGKGSAFKVYLPAGQRPVQTHTTAASSHAALRGGSETILLVEDEASVRRPAALWLRKFGYAVFEASCAEEALSLWEHHRSEIDLLFTDMIMPGEMTGLDLAQRLLEEKPALRVMISSGYSADLVRSDPAAERHFIFLPKPYEPSVLASALRKCLEHSSKNPGNVR